MAAEITLKVYMPEKLVLDKPVYRVVLPFDGKTLTVIKDRAPTLTTLNMGEVQVLDESDHIVETYYISGGMADIKEDTCLVLTEAFLDKKDLSLAKVRELNDTFTNPFYQWLVECFEKEASTRL